MHVLLSILIPAYNHPHGVRRLLDQIRPFREGVEVLISDDSNDNLAAAAIAAIASESPSVRYWRNQPPLGAANNWNLLLKQARGTYCLAMHHDEFPASKSMLDDLLALLCKADSPDVVILPVYIARSAGTTARLHFPARWGALLASYAPGFLMRRNVIGSPSALAVRRNLYLDFDPRLRWFLDVEQYYRLFSQRPSIGVLTSGAIISVYEAEHSITASIRSDLKKIRETEQRLIADKHSTDWLVICTTTSTPPARCFAFFEWICWGIFRILHRLISPIIVDDSQSGVFPDADYGPKG